ncbi:Response regulator receiver domain-containing protein [Flavobacterium resistens]|uniref:Response regulator n=1 Tax=Flavobacterium resistens TaxID=443612 RepID=A0A521AR30_9FLAO|nr:response regulator [Flavobacterium resistens]MRX69761.1 response regulator [Flavobacterium resistens]SMO37231.1 Response regulator receiver domain-containing protein [Flavobacterium resistens]
MIYKNILQIDDDVDDCEFFMEALQAVSDADYTAMHNSVEALNRLIRQELIPDIIFLDLNMPIMSGFEFLVAIKTQKIIQDIPVVIFSTSQFEETKLKARNYGAKEFISKPSDFNELKKIISDFTV